MQLLFAVADAFFTIIAFEMAYNIRRNLGLQHPFFFTVKDHLTLLVFCIALWVSLGTFQRVYEYLDSARSGRVLLDTTRQCLVGGVLIVVFEYLIRLDLSRSFLLLFLAADLVLLTLFRWNSRHVVGRFERRFGTPYHLLIVGSAARSARLQEKLFHDTPFLMNVSSISDEVDLNIRLPRILAQQIVDEVIFCVEGNQLAALEEIFLMCDEEGVRTRVALDFFPHVNSEMSFDRVGTAPLLTFSSAPDDEFRLILKRTFDVVASFCALVILSPICLLSAVLIRLTSPGAVLYRQIRCGLNGRRFVLYKFRSMVENAESMRGELMHLNEKEIAFKLKDDPRVTRIGHWLRKFSVDEWPQFYNVLRGDMSIVGPRPPLPEEVDHYRRWQRRRLRMRPGLTCLWAITGRDKLTFESWMRLDMSYIDNWSLMLDWSIIVRTIPRVLTGSGAH